MRFVVIGLVLVATACVAAPQRPTRSPADPLEHVSAAELYTQGLALAKRRDHVRAEQYFVAAMAKGQPEALVMPALVKICVRSSRFRAALRYAYPYLTRVPQDWRLRQVVAVIHMALGEREVAQRQLERVIETEPDAADAHFQLGVLAYDELEFGRANVQFSRYLELAPTGAHAAEAREAMARQPVRVLPTPTRSGTSGGGA